MHEVFKMTMGVAVAVGLGISVSVAIGSKRQRDVRIVAFGSRGCVHVVGNEQRRSLGVGATRLCRCRQGTIGVTCVWGQNI